MSTTDQRAANAANAQHSTGPTSKEGQARSSQNAFKNGLASGRVIIDGEDPAEFQALVDRLLAEHQPATETESILVHSMATHHWLENRAQRLQTIEFEKAFEAGEAVPKTLPILIRYETANNRAFHKSLDALLKLKKQRPNPEIGFVSQNAPEPAPARDLTPETKQQLARQSLQTLAHDLVKLADGDDLDSCYDRHVFRMGYLGIPVDPESMKEIRSHGRKLFEQIEAA